MTMVLTALPMLAGAQVGRGGARGAGRRGGMGPNPVAPLINMRRQLDLSSRQVAALDSIERGLLQRNQAIADRLRARRDSLVSGARGMRTPEERLALRTRLDSLAPLRQQLRRNDSTARAAAMRVLTDSQRTRVAVMQAERRGFAMGRMMGRRGGGGFGARGMGPGFGPRARMGYGPGFAGPMGRRGFGGNMGPRAFRGGIGPGNAAGIRLRRFRPGMGGDGFGAGMGPMGPGGGMGPQGFGREAGPGMGGRMMPPPDRSGDPGQGPPMGARGMRGMRGRMGPPAAADSTRPDSAAAPRARVRRPPPPPPEVPRQR